MRTRWPDEIAGSHWEFGANLAYMKKLAAYWAKGFDWRKIEREINRYPNFLAEIDGHKTHFAHVKGKEKHSIPLILTHGWPGSFLEFMKLIPLLTEGPAPAFDVVIPSMPGFGFSERITERGCNVRYMADLWCKLMKNLGYDRFGAQGGDFGAGVTTALALKYPQHVIAAHLNYIPGSDVPYLSDGQPLSQEEVEFGRRAGDWYDREGAYDHQQRTKPITLGYSLNDSPAGLCAWIVEKFHGWSDCKGDLESVFTKDELLANVTLYWVTETIHSSMRLYYENSKIPWRLGGDEYVSVPVGIAKFALEDPFPPRVFINKGYNVQHWSEFPEGGHFAAMEKPKLLAKDVKDFFRTLGMG